jgi:hypothetical protein
LFFSWCSHHALAKGEAVMAKAKKKAKKVAKKKKTAKKRKR